ncbi:hypothetical protein BWQ96_00396 [Gracilariopsis chorda]|uniref:Uncharacterized protein n=1 Tax=Gracilariopsis chorda TaxID=448386 RepID=A0A2V3J5T8_9FLOR|nr:hypothetical protein BWQ96_00396 [Gracilariopsis chorda]|eukprot:PXF49744.1 hypothetical protein BWQ96_00396 [Gracilariopsis chorda]
MSRQLLRASAQIRRASAWASPRWSRAVRAQSNIDTAQDPPTAPLPEQHELGEGVSDFSNWVEKHEDVSSAEAVGGFVFIMGVCYAIHQYAVNRTKSSDPTFTRREFPTVQTYLPTWKEAADSVRKE